MGKGTRPSKRTLERKIFKFFLNEHPNFALEPIKKWWQPLKDPPDFFLLTASGKRIGVELGGWLHQKEMTFAKRKEAVEASILKAVGKQPDNNCEHIYSLWLGRKADVCRVERTDRSAFRNELFRLIRAVDVEWPRQRYWHSPQGHSCNDLTGYPTLDRYLTGIRFHPRRQWRGGGFILETWPRGQRWMTFPCLGGPYDEQTMLGPLKTVLGKKIAHYHAKPKNLHEFHLLIHYDQAIYYNSPVRTPFFGFDDAARLVTESLVSAGQFDSIFLFLAFTPGQRAYQLWPHPPQIPLP